MIVERLRGLCVSVPLLIWVACFDYLKNTQFAVLDLAILRLLFYWDRTHRIRSLLCDTSIKYRHLSHNEVLYMYISRRHVAEGQYPGLATL